MEVHETAFVTCAFRSMHRELSKDSFAHLWLNNRVQKWVDAYLTKVTPEESAAHSLRNRYFLETIKELTNEHQLKLLINFGCGFSMYPYLLPEGLRHIEIDMPQLINYKREQTALWQDKKVLPPRDIEFIGCDFGTRFKDSLLQQIRELKGDDPCFILLEGVLFFLTREETDELFGLFDDIQEPGDFIGSVSFREKDTKNKAFSRLKNFMREDSGEALNKVYYQTVEDTYYNNLPSYELLEHQDFFSLAPKYGYSPSHEPDMVLNEQLYLLKKK